VAPTEGTLNKLPQRFWRLAVVQLVQRDAKAHRSKAPAGDPPEVLV